MGLVRAAVHWDADASWSQQSYTRHRQLSEACSAQHALLGVGSGACERSPVLQFSGEALLLLNALLHSLVSWGQKGACPAVSTSEGGLTRGALACVESPWSPHSHPSLVVSIAVAHFHCPTQVHLHEMGRNCCHSKTVASSLRQLGNTQGEEGSGVLCQG